MPKRSFVRAGSSRKRVKTYARKNRLPRSIVLNGESIHRHTVCCSSSSTAVMYVNYPASGVATFAVSPLIQSQNLSIQFSLATVDIFLGGVAALSVPVPNTAELQAMYDTYQLAQVEIRMYLGANDSKTGLDDTGIAGAVNYNSNWPLPIVGYAPDTDDAANTSITQLQQYSTYKQLQPIAGKPLVTRIVPACAGGVWNGPVRSGYTRLTRQDVNVANPGVPHYGLKMCVDGMKSTAGAAGTGEVASLMSMFFKLHFVMKNTR
ncbi:MAG: capsid protein [Cressdnaviricota sp.]|nr:MAG: capsid protein [Cressdnaviricota sp.]